MSSFFLKIVNMSIAASWLILAVVLLRVVLKKAPKWINVLLWGIVAFRLICPFSFESALSLIPSAETISLHRRKLYRQGSESNYYGHLCSRANCKRKSTSAFDSCAGNRMGNRHHSHARLCCRQLFPLAKESRCIPFCAGQHLDL